ncbi:hypothetical protein [Embleya sp. NPDC059259]|uniref:hypothetical protein n=1 Tax=unclassified Embleya TaxID=2699296 RepID=UPI00368B1070
MASVFVDVGDDLFREGGEVLAFDDSPQAFEQHTRPEGRAEPGRHGGNGSPSAVSTPCNWVLL